MKNIPTSRCSSSPSVWNPGDATKNCFGIIVWSLLSTCLAWWAECTEKTKQTPGRIYGRIPPICVEKGCLIATRRSHTLAASHKMARNVLLILVLIQGRFKEGYGRIGGCLVNTNLIQDSSCILDIHDKEGLLSPPQGLGSLWRPEELS